MASIMIHANRGIVVTNIKPTINDLISLSIDVINPAAMDGDKLVGGDTESVTFFLTPEQVASLVGSLYGQYEVSKIKEQADA